MEITFPTLTLWLLYQVLGLHSFRIGRMHQDPVKHHPQRDDIFVPNWTKRISKPRDVVSDFDIGKRFFEFNPVAFKKETKTLPAEGDITRLIHFSPFMSSLEHLRTYSEPESVPKFKSSFISNDKKPKHLKPYVDHFSGVRSFSFHLNNPVRFEEVGAKANEWTSPDVKHATRGISNRAFLEQSNVHLIEEKIKSDHKNTEAMIANLEEYEKGNDYMQNPDNVRSPSALAGRQNHLDINKVSKHRGIHNKDSLNENMPLTQTNTEPLNSDFERYFDGDKNETDIFMVFRGGDEHEHRSMPKPTFDWSKPINDEAIHGETVVSPSKIPLDSESYGFISVPRADVKDYYTERPHHVKGPESLPSVGIDTPSTDEIHHFEEFGSFGSESNQLGAWGSAIFENNDIPYWTDYEFENFGDILDGDDNNLYHSQDGLSKLIETGAKPHFGMEEVSPNEYESFDQSFGSFNTDNSDCETIGTKSCVSNSDCSCYGLYQCNSGTCTTITNTAPVDDEEHPSMGHWDEQPVEIESWKK